MKIKKETKSLLILVFISLLIAGLSLLVLYKTEKSTKKDNFILKTDSKRTYPNKNTTKAKKAQKSLIGDSLEGDFTLYAPKELKKLTFETFGIENDEAIESLESNSMIATATWYSSRLYGLTTKNAWIKGYAKRGAQIPVVGRIKRQKGCKSGELYELIDGGAVCTSEGFRVDTVRPANIERVNVSIDADLPFKYAVLKQQGAPRMKDLPTLDEIEQILKARKGEGIMPDIVFDKLKGAVWLTFDKEEKVGEHKFARTAADRYVFRDDIEIITPPNMRGEINPRMPIAFLRHTAKIYCKDEGYQCGKAEKHSRFTPFNQNNKSKVYIDKHRWIKKESASIAWPRNMPSWVKGKDQWIHVDLTEQTLIAYEGKLPVFATLVSSGKPGYDTPSGRYQVQKKFISTLMSGEDAVDGIYYVAEVPWTMFYDAGFALHGAYWHNGFGRTRSHGCTNIAPADARWLFYWSEPRLPKGWHGSAVQNGVQILLTRADEEGVEGD